MSNKSTKQEEAGFYRLNWLQRIGFGSGDLAQNLIYQTISMYLLFFYTNVYGLDAGAAATMFLVVRVGRYSIDCFRHSLFLGWLLWLIAIRLRFLRGYVDVLHFD